MNKFILPIFISTLWLFYRSNQFFEGNINTTPEVKSFIVQKKFFSSVSKKL